MIETKPWKEPVQLPDIGPDSVTVEFSHAELFEALSVYAVTKRREDFQPQGFVQVETALQPRGFKLRLTYWKTP